MRSKLFLGHFERHILQARLSAELAEYLEVSASDSAKTPIGYAMDVDDSCELRSLLVSSHQSLDL